LLKTISWRIIATGITIGTIYIFTGNIVFSGEVGIVINAVKLLPTIFMKDFMQKWSNFLLKFC
jgi:uncharacterized membrane protein